jgi:hypothetical protein
MMAIAIAAFTFTACEDVPEPYNNPYDSLKPEEEVTPLDPEGDGTEAAPFNVSGINEYATNLGLASGSSDTKEVYVKGIISNVANFQEKYGEIDYYVSDDKDGKTGQFYIYGGYGLDGAKFTSLADLSVGDTVLVSGTIKNHQGGIQFNYGSKIHSIKKGEGGGDTPSADEVGSKDAPKSVTEALAAINAMEDGATSTEFWYVKGKVVKVTTNQASFDQYKNLNYLISEDGTESNTITVYAGNGLDNTQFSGIDALKQGDEVVVYGHIQKYVKNDKMTPEIAKGNYLVKYTAGGNGGGNTGDDVGTKDAPKTVAEALAAVDALANGATTEQFWFVKGKVKQVITAADKISQYKNIDYLITDDGNNEIKVFRGKNLDNTDFTSADQLQVDDEVVVYGQLMKYEDTKNNKIVPEVAQGNYLVKRTTGGSEGGGEGDKVTSLTNGDFESWADGVPTGWKSACTASSATLEQSTDAHGGSYSVNVNGNESSNKRLASQEITLEAGTYTFSFWAKATVSDASQARPGFVPVVDGTAVSSSYTYGDYATLSTDWQQVSYKFTLTAETTVCLLVMNPKKSSYSSGKDILIDDATLTKQ